MSPCWLLQVNHFRAVGPDRRHPLWKACFACLPLLLHVLFAFSHLSWQELEHVCPEQWLNEFCRSGLKTIGLMKQGEAAAIHSCQGPCPSSGRCCNNRCSHIQLQVRQEFQFSIQSIESRLDLDGVSVFIQAPLIGHPVGVADAEASRSEEFQHLI